MSNWKLDLHSGEDQSFLEIINLLKEYKPKELRWVKGKGFEPDPYRNRSHFTGNQKEVKQ